MKTYFEAIEDTEDELVDKDFIKEEIKEEDTDKEIQDKIKLKEKLDKTYKYRTHWCDHDEETQTGCTTSEWDSDITKIKKEKA